ncbi:hypothetical protein [Aeromonas sp. R6-2]|uniref:hypothetical protein n=1 Tax=unclassified Aeromonas TaxID=257493 RepID=UPI0034A36976
MQTSRIIFCAINAQTRRETLICGVQPHIITTKLTLSIDARYVGINVHTHDYSPKLKTDLLFFIFSQSFIWLDFVSAAYLIPLAFFSNFFQEQIDNHHVHCIDPAQISFSKKSKTRLKAGFFCTNKRYRM